MDPLLLLVHFLLAVVLVIGVFSACGNTAPAAPAETAAPAAEAPETGFSQIAGLEEAKQIVTEEIIHPLLYADVYKKFKRENRGGLLLFGPPGGGKTMMARAIAAESHMAFFPVRCSDIVGRYFGEAEKRVRALFQAAREARNAGRADAVPENAVAGMLGKTVPPMPDEARAVEWICV